MPVHFPSVHASPVCTMFITTAYHVSHAAPLFHASHVHHLTYHHVRVSPLLNCNIRNHHVTYAHDKYAHVAPAAHVHPLTPFVHASHVHHLTYHHVRVSPLLNCNIKNHDPFTYAHDKYAHVSHFAHAGHVSHVHHLTYHQFRV
ncbi:MAG: hypothetical protein WCL18_03655 [bacterium]